MSDYINIRDMVGLDFETYGAVSLPDHGLERYVSDTSFTPLIASVAGVPTTTRFWLWDGRDNTALAEAIRDKWVVAHNAGFEERVLQWLGMHELPQGYIDSAVWARAMGAAGKLEAAGPQILNVDKLESGSRLIRLFSIPSAEQLEAGNRNFNPQLILDHKEDWSDFQHYCDVDAELGLGIVNAAMDQGWFSWKEAERDAVTRMMNKTGWRVDLDMVEEMNRRYLENQQDALEIFRRDCDAADLNINSYKQLKDWCLERGIRARSFDEKNVDKLVKKISDQAATMLADHPRAKDYWEVLQLLKTKQILGGSSLKKLKTIIDTTSPDGRLRDQYLHIGAGQTWRTTGRSVQMQNLKRLGAQPDNMLELEDPDMDWDNDQLASNLRQVFTASVPDGSLIVGDFSSIESRGLAWLAWAEWKLQAYRQGQDMYKVLAAKKFGIGYEAVTKDQRTFGKVGELSCGYQAGGGAVQSFAEGMGVMLTQAEATDIVDDWRATNPEVVELWAKLDSLMWEVYESGQTATRAVGPPDQGYLIRAWTVPAPQSLQAQHPKAVSLMVGFEGPSGMVEWMRVFHGIYRRGRSLCYYKPTERKTGNVWVNHTKDPKTKEIRWFSIYGGKLAGILTQSLCREIFFETLVKVNDWVQGVPYVKLVGQFHDEMVLDYRPLKAAHKLATVDRVASTLEQYMSSCRLPGFPMAAEIKWDYRYTK